MPILTHLKLQKNKQKVNVFLDNKFSFSLNLEQVIKLGLKEGQSFSQEQIEKIFLKSLSEKIYAAVLNFLSFRPRSEKEICDYLQKKFLKLNINNHFLKRKIKETIINRLKKQKLIDDYQFGLWWLEQRNNFRPRGKKILWRELKQKGLSLSLIKSLLSKISAEQEREQIKKIINKKIKFFKNLPSIKIKQKLFSYLINKGFAYELVKNIIDETIQE